MGLGGGPAFPAPVPAYHIPLPLAPRRGAGAAAGLLLLRRGAGSAGALHPSGPRDHQGLFRGWGVSLRLPLHSAHPAGDPLGRRTALGGHHPAVAQRPGTSSGGPGLGRGGARQRPDPGPSPPGFSPGPRSGVAPLGDPGAAPALCPAPPARGGMGPAAPGAGPDPGSILRRRSHPGVPGTQRSSHHPLPTSGSARVPGPDRLPCHRPRLPGAGAGRISPPGSAEQAGPRPGPG